MNLRASIAIAACKCVRLAARLMHKGGTAKPGDIALRIYPELLSLISKDVASVVVTGTNGKTTSCRMLEEAFKTSGADCIANRSGANMASGIVTELAMYCGLNGRCRKSFAVMECDEAWTKHVLPAMQPKVFLVTNLFKDQVDRYGDVGNTLAAIRAGIEKCPETVLCLNADDPVTSALADGLENPVIWYGLEQSVGHSGAVPGENELRRCLSCGAELEYSYVNYAHLGGFKCPGCGRARHDTDIGVTAVAGMDMDGSRVLMDIKGHSREVDINLPAEYNIYNAAGAVAAAIASGLDEEAAVGAVGSFNCGFGRMEKFPLGKKGARMVLVKNAASFNQVIRFLGGQKEEFELVLVTNNRVNDGVDMSWIEDAEFEKLADMEGLKGVTFSGTCAGMMRERFARAGIAENLLRLEPDQDKLAEQVNSAGRAVFITPSYTGMMEFRPHLAKMSGAAEFWN